MQRYQFGPDVDVTYGIRDIINATRARTNGGELPSVSKYCISQMDSSVSSKFASKFVLPNTIALLQQLIQLLAV